MSRIDYSSTVIVIRISKKNISCLLGKLKTEFTSPIAKSTSPGLSNTTFFARLLKFGLIEDNVTVFQ